MKDEALDLLLAVRKIRNLRKAWAKVYANGDKSARKETKDEVHDYAVDIETKLKRITDQLRLHQYHFSPAVATPVERPGKDPRPLIRAVIPDRIVQRAILNVLQSPHTCPGLAQYFNVPTSFGGIPGRKVRQAVDAVHAAIKGGATFFIRSDIKGFFTHIPKATVIDIISSAVNSNGFTKLVESAITLELSNLSQIGTDVQFYPLEDEGVPQGCCLSPLMGNILLSTFDKTLNGRGVICIRYVDDFILLGSKQSHVEKAFENAVQMLSQYNMSAYDPKTTPDKADKGPISNGIPFLGCTIKRDVISPDRDSRKRLLNKVSVALNNSVRELRNPQRMYDKGVSMAQTLSHVDNILKGWGNQYSFCNDKTALGQLEDAVKVDIDSYIKRIGQALKHHRSSGNKRKQLMIIGLHRLTQSKTNPIIK